ncbi:hypothetical protein Nepgr_019519 [Nepenthes gracilis]|uniref:TATA element modulatory factor 1 TATA binding domain-containing protein n=1 Tax=Nepenthes gracilis TaxID=150966 RepID=A0AAD3SU60_NEPGR|nr:hypothetical protein Nepgr_019519 [Nepenthes gracilis]
MDWFGGRVSLGNLDIAGAVNKLSESVKNIEKNFDSALGLEDKNESTSAASGTWSSAADRKGLFEPVRAFMGHKGGEDIVESKDDERTAEARGAENESNSTETLGTAPLSHSVEGGKGEETDGLLNSSSQQILLTQEGNIMLEEQNVHADLGIAEEISTSTEDAGKVESYSHNLPTTSTVSAIENVETKDSVKQPDEEENPDVGSLGKSESVEAKVGADEIGQFHSGNIIPGESIDAIDMHEDIEEKKLEAQSLDSGYPLVAEASTGSQTGLQIVPPSSCAGIMESESLGESSIDQLPTGLPKDEVLEMVSEPGSQENDSMTRTAKVNMPDNCDDIDAREHRLSLASNVSDTVDAVIELEKVNKEMKMMEVALQGAARQAQAKADEIAKLLNENERLKSVIEGLQRKSNESEIESLREEYHQRVSTLERKVYALTKERDTLRREQSKKSDAAALLKEKDEIISQVMAEGEELSKKQAAQEATIRKLRAQIRELEEERKGLITKLQAEENKVESIKKDKAATEKLLQESMENHQAELTAQKEYFTNALNAAKEAEVLAETRANYEARTELESRLREAEEREMMLVQALEELRETLSRKEQQAVFREDMLRRDMEDLRKQYQASERRCEELITQVPDSTRPLLRQIEAMQETTARRAEAWAAVERSLNSRLQEAEAKAAAAEEKERSVNERLSQTLSRINVLEAQISCVRAEQTQLMRSLEKERQRAAENRQEYLTAKEEYDTQEGRANQLEEELKELKRKHKQELQEALAHGELLQQELDREKNARLDLERKARVQPSSVSDQSPNAMQKSSLENGKFVRKLSSASSVDNMEESFFLQGSFDSSGNLLERRNSGEASMTPYYLKSMTPSAFEATLRQKEGEVSSYMSRLASMESIRNSLAEELVKMTEQCEKLRSEAAVLPGIRAELEALRRRHTAALELMGERDEELEELRNDIVDLKEMYREQVNLLVNKIQILGSQMGAA